MKNLFQLFTLAFCFTVVYSGDLYFGRTQVCTDTNLSTGPCQHWNITVTLSYYYGYYGYMCFPGSTRVMTINGPISITGLRVGDEILAYDFELGRNVYTPVTAWIHRDTDSKVEFNTIEARGGNAYKASAGHNIAYNNNGQIGFKYSDQLQPGD